MQDLLTMMGAVKDFNLGMCKGLNLYSRDIAMLHFAFLESMTLRNTRMPSADTPCDDAEKGLTCAMPL